MGKYLLSDIATIVDCEHKTAPIVENSDYYSIRTTNIKNGKIDFDSSNRVSYETYLKWTNRAVPEAEDIIIAREAPVGEVGWIKNGYKICLGQRTVLIKVTDDKVNKKYLLYFLANPSTKHELQVRSTGSVVSHLNVKDIKNFEINFPSLPEQKAIASVLSSLDDKIDLLHRQNKTLEALAETLFRQWFLEEAQEDWEEVKLGDYIVTNKTSITKDTLLKKIRYLDTGSLIEGKIEKFQKLDLVDAPSRARRIVRHNDILISTVRPNQKHYGILKHPDTDIIASTGFCVITCKQIDPHFVYLLLTTDDMTEYLHSIAEGSTSTYPSLKPSDIENLKFLLPPMKKLKFFSEFADNTWKKIDYIHEQIRTLEKLRDTLLPKIMSGEIRISMEKNNA